MQPPCVMPKQPLNPCARRLYAEKVIGHVDLAAEWAGWRLRGRWLISPEGDRINPERLRGILFREANEKRRHRAGQKSGLQEAGAKVRQLIAKRKTPTPGSST